MGESRAREQDEQTILERVLNEILQQQQALQSQKSVMERIADSQRRLEAILQHDRWRMNGHDQGAESQVPRPNQCCQQDDKSQESWAMQVATQMSHSSRNGAANVERSGDPTGSPDRSLNRKAFKTQFAAMRYGMFAKSTSTPTAPEISSEPSVPIETPRAQRFRSFITSKQFEFVMGTVITVNMLVLGLDLQLEGELRGQALGLKEVGGMHTKIVEKLYILYRIFLVMYVLEFVLRLWALRWEFFRSVTNLIDMGLVMLSAMEPLGAASSPFGSSMALARLVRVVRLLRVARLVKCIRVFRVFQDLYILLKTLSLCFYTLFWSMVLVWMCVFAASLVICQLVSGFIEDESEDSVTRVWIYENFGTTSSAALTMFECAITPKWNSMLRRFTEEVHVLYGVFWLLYVVGVNFAVLKVVTALFIKQALSVAKAEEDRMSVAEELEKERIAGLLKEIFRVGDTSGDGVISKSEFDVLIARQDVCELIHKMGLETGEVHMLFNLLCEGDGEADYHEFLVGALRMQGNARTVDTIQILHEQLHLKRYVEIGIAEVKSCCIKMLESRPRHSSFSASSQVLAMHRDEALPATLSPSAATLAIPTPASSAPFEAPWAEIGKKVSNEAVLRDVVPVMDVHESEPSQDALLRASLDRHL